MTERKLLVNKIQCPDGTVLRSFSRHHFVEHTQADGREYFVDGGIDYQRIGHSDNQYVNLAVYVDDPIELIREHFTWTSWYDKDGKPLGAPETRLLKDLTDNHVLNLVEYTKSRPQRYPEYIVDVFVQESELRGLTSQTNTV